MRSSEPQSLPDWIEQGYRILSARIADAGDEGFSRDQAIRELRSHEEFPDSSADAEYAIDQLLNSGWFYEVQGDLRVTDPEL